MIEIKSASSQQKAYEQFKTWLFNEWGPIEQLYSEDTPALAMPILAFENDVLVGGMSFILYNKPGTSSKTMWINTLYIATEYRGKGIASQIILAAESVFTRWKEADMYVFTDKPSLYSKLGWQILIEEKEGWVLHKHLSI